MTNCVPGWWMCGNRRMPAGQDTPQQPDTKPEGEISQTLSALTEHLRHPDGETLLLLALLWLLWQEKADRRLLLALAYIII